MIKLRNIHKSFGRQEVLRGIDLDVDRGEIFALLGPNGAGKTTIVSILSTLVRPDSGMATVNGHDVVQAPDAVKASISLTGQSAAVDEILSGRANLRMMGVLGGLDRGASVTRADALLARFDLVAAADKRAKTYSGGMRRRLDLAISLLNTPPVVFLDEPTTGLDTRSRQELWNDIRDLAARGTTVLLTTQYLDEADALADRVAVIDHGTIVAHGTPAELKARVGCEVLVVLDENGAATEEIPTDGTADGLRRALSAVDARAAVAVRRPTLDDVFLSVTSTPALERIPA